MFPSKLRKFVRLAPNQAYLSMVHLMRENLGTLNVEGEEEEKLIIRAKIGGALGVAVNMQVFPEGDASTLEFSFGYRNILFISVIALIALTGCSLIFGTPVPMLGAVLILPLAYKANFAVMSFLGAVNEALPHLEQEYARLALMEDRKRWQLESKDTEALYRRLREKHIKTWGNTNVLEYKIAEYERQGLTHNEAIRKTAEEEGIY